MKRRILSFLLALVLVAGMLPMPVRAEGECICTVHCTQDSKNDACTVCSADPSQCEIPAVVPPAANVTGVTLSGGPLNLLVGGEATLTATVQTEGEANKEVTWSTSDASVATVSGGKVTAVSAGTATITATSVGDTTKAATCTVSVTAPVAVTKVSLNETEATIEKNGTKVLTATVEPDNATNPAVAWSTSNETVATVAGGTVTAVGVGTAIITAKAGDCTATCAVTVPGVVLPASATAYLCESLQLTAAVTPADHTLTWTSSDPETATVSDTGVVTPQKAGAVTITATSSDSKSAICAVNIKPHDADLSVETAFGLRVGDSKSMGAAISPACSCTADASITYSSNDTDIITVAADGTMTAVAAGSAEITLMIAEDENSKVIATVTVKPALIDIAAVATVQTDITVEGYLYDGKEHKPEVTVTVLAPDSTIITLKENTDYILSFQQKAKAGEEPVNAGAYQVVITGIGDYKGVVALDFIIKPVELTAENTTINVAEGPYFAGAEPAVKVELNVDGNSEELAEENYSVTFENNDKPGTATVKVTGTGNYTGSVTEKYAIEAGPANQTVNVGTTAEFTVIAGANWTHQWQIKKGDNWENVSGATKSSYTTEAATVEMSGTQYRCVITNSKGVKVTSPAATLTVKVPITNMALNKTSLTLTVDKTEKLVATVKPDNANQQVTWNSSNPGVASVDANGNVTAKKAGTATITAVSVADNSKKATCTVNVGYAVVFESNGGSKENSQIVLTDKKVIKPVKTPTREVKKDEKVASWRFDGWYTTATFEKDTEWNFDTVVTKDITLYAKWVGQYELKFNDNTSATVKKMPETMMEDSREFKVTSTKPTRSGYSFSSWNTKKDGSGTKVKAGKTFTMPDDEVSVTLYAQWKKADPYNARTGDYILIAVGVLALSGLALAGLWVYSKKKK